MAMKAAFLSVSFKGKLLDDMREAAKGPVPLPVDLKYQFHQN